MELKLLQSKINLLEAEINQVKESDFYTEAQRETLLPKLTERLDVLLQQKAALTEDKINNIEVIDAEIVEPKKENSNELC